MKKGVFFLLLAAIMAPFAMQAQQNASVHIDTTINACESFTWSVNNTTYTTSGVHTEIVNDTLYILDLSIHPNYTITVPTPVQGGCVYTWGNTQYNTSGTYTQTFESMYGCDSIVTINLVISGTAYADYTKTVCEYLIWKGDTLRTSGTHNKTVSSDACDSILTMNLTVIDPVQKSFDTIVTGCGEARFRFGTSAPFRVTVDGTDTTSERYSYSNAAARNMFHPRTIEKCFDSIVNVHFNIKNHSIVRQSVASCDKYVFVYGNKEKEYYYSKIDTVKVGSSANGCDSTYILNITIRTSPVVTISGDLRVAPNSTAVLRAECDQTVSYLWSNGSTADSLVLNNVTENIDVSLTGTNNSTGCFHTTYVTVLANAAINNADDQLINVYPNPTDARINIASGEVVKNITVFNTLGQQVLNAGDNTTVDLTVLTNGTYVVRVELQNGKVATRTVVLSK